MTDPRYVQWLESQLKALGRRVLDLQSQTTRAFHSARRFQIVATLVSEMASALEMPDRPSLERTFLGRTYDQLYIDAVALFRMSGDGQRLEPFASTGSSVGGLTVAGAPEAFCYSASGSTPSAFTRSLIDASGMRFILWAWDAETQIGLLLGKELETRDFYDRFDAGDAHIVRSALRIYLDTRRRLDAEAALRSRLDQANTLNHISSKFIHIGPESFRATVQEALGALTTLLMAERGAIFRIDPVGQMIEQDFLYLRDGPAPAPAVRPGLPLFEAKPLVDALRLQEIMLHERGHPLADLPLPGATARAHSVLYIPLVYGQSLDGFIYMVCDRACIDELPDAAFLRTAASTFATALAAERERQANDALQQQIQRGQKLDSLGVLAGGIAHDFNNILTPILSGLELVRFSAQPTAIPLIDHALDAVERARSLVKQILLFSRKNPVQRHPVDVAGVLREAAELLRASLPSTIAMILDLPDAKELVVLGDAHRLEQVLVNLGTNAWQAMEGSKGQLIFRAAPDVGQDAIHVQVIDTGPGIPASVQPHIYDPFYTTKPAGTGMGLAVAHGIVSDHGGRISLETGPTGTRFDIWLPAAHGAAVSQAAASASPKGGGESVLIVDDEPVVGARIEDLLRRLGYQTERFTRPEEALSTLQAMPGAWHLLVTDFTMPGMTGIELAREAIICAPDIAIVLCTGYHEPLSHEALSEAKIHGLVHKPFRLAELAEQVRTALDHREPVPSDSLV
jgi:signal transduction histidine kinase